FGVSGQCLDLHGLADFTADERRSYRRRGRNLALAGVGFGGTDDAPDFLYALGILDGNGPAHSHGLGRTVILDHLAKAQRLLEAADLAFQERLLALGILVLAAVADVAIVLGAADPFCDLATANRPQELQLPFQLCFTLWCKV